VATSGSDNFAVSRNDIIDAALRKIGIAAEGETTASQQTQDAATDLNLMVKSWQAAGLNLWKYEEMILFLVTDTHEYDLGSTTSDHWVKTSGLTTTTTNADAAISATAITVTSITGITNGDFVGVVTDDNTIHWTTVNGAPSGTTVTLTTGLDVAATSGNKLYAFTTKGVRPLQVTHGRAQNDSTSETELTALSREDYFRLSNKSADGITTQFYYNPKLTNGKMYIWPEISDERIFLNLSTQIQIEDFDTASDNPDVPAEYFDSLVWGLAKRLLTEYGIIDPATVQLVLGMAEETYSMAEEFGVENTSLIFMPDWTDFG